MSLTKPTARASLAVLIGQLFMMAIRLVGVGLLARVVMLRPDDFGAAALVLYIAGCVGQFRRGGLEQFLVRQQEPDKVIEGTANTLNVVLGLATFGLMLLVSGWVAPLLGAGDSLKFTFQLGAIFVLFTGFEALPKANLMREMRFKPIMAVQVIFAVLLPYAGAVAIACLWHRGPETAFLPYLFGAILVPIPLTIMARRIPLSFSPEVAGKILRFGLPLGLATLFSKLFARCELFFLAIFTTPENLGYYTMAMLLVRVPGERFIAMLGGVFMSAFSRIQNERSRLREAYLKSLYVFTLVCGAALVILATCSHDVVALIYGPNFKKCGVLVAILASGFVVRFPSYFVGPLLTALGKTKTIAIVNAGLGVMQVSAFATAAVFGLKAVCITVIAVGLFTSVVWIIVLHRLIDLQVVTMLAKLGRILLALSIAYVAALVISVWLPAGDTTVWQVLRIGIRVMVVVGLTVILALLWLPSMVHHIKSLLPRKAS